MCRASHRVPVDGRVVGVLRGTSAARFHIAPAGLCMASNFVIIALGCEALPDNWDQYICINYTKRS